MIADPEFPPSAFGPYEAFGEPVARDWACLVYRARDSRAEGRRLLVAAYGVDPALVGPEATLRLALALARLRTGAHPGMARVVESGEREGRPFAVMEDPGLDAAYPRSLLDLEPEARTKRACELFADLAERFDEAHARGFVHGAIRPANLVVATANGVSRLLAVGAGSFAYDEVALARAWPEALRVARYAAPEVTGALPRAPDWRVDAYSLGVALFEAIASRLPFDADDAATLAHLHVAKDCPRASESGARSDATLDAILAKALAKEPERRYQRVRALASDLSRWLGGERGFAPGADDDSPRPSWIANREGDASEPAASGNDSENGKGDAGPVRASTSRGAVTRPGDRAKAVMEACAKLASLADPLELCESVLSGAMTLCGASRGYLFSADRDTKALVLRVAVHLDPGRVPEYSRTLIRTVFESGEVALVRDAPYDPAVSGFRSVADLGLRSILCVPLRLAGSVEGVCYMDNPLAGGVFAEEDADLASSFASLAAVALRDAFPRGKAAAGRAPRVTRIGENAIERVLAHLRANLRRDVPREELEKITGYNGDHLGKIFKSHVGTGIAGFVARERVALAIDLMGSTDLPVTEIAFEAGFGSLNAFYRAFEAETGTTPTAYRRRAPDVLP